MIEIIHPGQFSLLVDRGRRGHRDVGVPTSSALDQYALDALGCLMDRAGDGPAIEAFGENFSLRFHSDMCFAITGAKVRAHLEGRPVQSWSSVRAKAGETLRVEEVVEGFRYFVGFSGIPSLKKIIGSYSTNLECRFGGFQGRRLRREDRIDVREIRMTTEGRIPDRCIPHMGLPHVLRVIAGPEANSFLASSMEAAFGGKEGTPFTVSTHSNRTGIRLEGKSLTFRVDADKSIISEGLLPGTIQIPGDGLPIIQLHERTIGGYARAAVVAKADHDLLAHLKPGDTVAFRTIVMEEAEILWNKKMEMVTLMEKQT